MSAITHIFAQEILDSRGNPTLEATVILASSAQGRACVPSGASTGTHEALELRDGDPCRYRGKGVLQAVQHVNTAIRQALLGKEASQQQALDQLMLALDGTANKACLGANAILAVSLALAKAVATDYHQGLYQYLATLLGYKRFLLPVPMFNILNGGMHADNNLAIQEFMILPVGSISFSEALRCGSEIFASLRELLKKRGLNTNVGDEGGFAPHLRSHAEAFELILMAIEQAGYRAGYEVYLGMDVASSSFFEAGYYRFEGALLSAGEWVAHLANWVKQYPVISIEDGMAEDDRQGWAMLTQQLGRNIQLVGDDLFATNPNRLAQGIDHQLANAILIKLNQIGSVSETLTTVTMATQAHYAAVISHRSGETEDTSIADLAVATGVGQIKAGAPCRTDRVAKYNQLLRLESSLQTDAVYAGRRAFSGLVE